MTDFQNGSDRVRLTAGLTFAQLTFVQDGANIRIRANGVDIAYLLNVQINQLNAGLVAAQGSIGLVPSEVPDYDLKSKILGKGGDRRFHGK